MENAWIGKSSASYVHAPEMPGSFSLSPLLSDPDMHAGIAK